MRKQIRNSPEANPGKKLLKSKKKQTKRGRGKDDKPDAWGKKNYYTPLFEGRLLFFQSRSTCFFLSRFKRYSFRGDLHLLVEFPEMFYTLAHGGPCHFPRFFCTGDDALLIRHQITRA